MTDVDGTCQHQQPTELTLVDHLMMVTGMTLVMFRLCYFTPTQRSLISGFLRVNTVNANFIFIDAPYSIIQQFSAQRTT